MIDHYAVLCLQALSLYKAEVPFENIFKIINITSSSIYHLWKKTIECGYQSESNKLLLLQYVKDAAHSERSQKVNKKLECELLANVQKDRNSHKKSL